MKKILSIMALVLFLSTPVFAQSDNYPQPTGNPQADAKALYGYVRAEMKMCYTVDQFSATMDLAKELITPFEKYGESHPEYTDEFMKYVGEEMEVIKGEFTELMVKFAVVEQIADSLKSVPKPVPTGNVDADVKSLCDYMVSYVENANSIEQLEYIEYFIDPLKELFDNYSKEHPEYGKLFDEKFSQAVDKIDFASISMKRAAELAGVSVDELKEELDKNPESDKE